MKPLQVGGSATSTESVEAEGEVFQPDSLKFQRLYDNLYKGNPLYFEVEAKDTWPQLRRHSIVEVVGNARLLQFEQMLEVAEEASKFVDIMPLFGQQVDETLKAQIAGMRALRAGAAVTAVVVEVLESPEHRFVTLLSNNFLRVPKTELVGEVTLFGSVQRVLKPGEKLPLATFFPSLASLQGPPPNRSQRRAKQPAKVQPATRNPFAEDIPYPACVVTPLALFK